MNLLDRAAAKLFPRDSRRFVIDMIPPRSVCCEVGVWKGDFAEQILRHAKPKKLYLVDPWLYFHDPKYDQALYGKRAGDQGTMDRIFQDVNSRFKRQVGIGTVEILRRTSDEAAAQLPDGRLDWVYIDANHSYEYCRNDIRLYTDKIRIGGLLALDDYSTNGWWKDGVIRAADEAAAEGRVEKIAVRNGQCVLRKIRN